MPEIIINGIKIDAPATDTILTAAQRAGIEIPHFCYHPELEYAGSCRMCLVELEKSPKLVTSCNTPVSEGMVIHTDTERVKKARAGVLEFLLINHPLDCPICDKAGECPLQDNYFKYSARESRYEEDKWHKNKKVDLGPLIVHDEERCILCTRCVRFMQDIAKSPQLIVVKRGSKNTLTTYPGAPLDNPYSLNTVDICPVGALTSKDFRFKCRAWYLTSVESVCPFCETGCNTVIQHKDNTVQRILPLKNEKVNGSFICDYGRLFRKYINARDRLSMPLVKSNKKDTTNLTTEESFNKIFAMITARAAAIHKSNGGAGGKDGLARETGVLLSPYLGVEEAYLALKFFGEPSAAAADMAVIGCGEGFDGFTVSDGYLISKEKSPNKAGISLLSDKMGIKFIGADALAANAGAKKYKTIIFIGPPFAVRDYYIKHGKSLDICDFVISLTTHSGGMADISDFIIPLSLWAESDGHFVNKNNIVQKYGAAVKPPMPEGGADYNVKILCRLASCFNIKAGYSSTADVFNEIKTRYKLFT
jgi:NADH-quinone oxidoreductase subunit G